MLIHSSVVTSSDKTILDLRLLKYVKISRIRNLISTHFLNREKQNITENINVFKGSKDRVLSTPSMKVASLYIDLEKRNNEVLNLIINFMG